MNNQHRIFTKVSKVSWRDRLLSMSQAGNLQAGKMLTINLRLRDEVFEASPVAQVAIEQKGKIVPINRLARSLFSLNIQNLGQPLSESDIHRKIPRLQSAIEQSCSEFCHITLDNVEIETNGDNSAFFDIQVTPLIEGESKILGVNISFVDVTSHQNLRREIDRYRDELEAAQEELQTSNEELETTNEELQSTNEELNVRTEELNRISNFMESILTSLKMGMVVLDSRLSIQLWNNRTTELWGFRVEEVRDRFFFDLDIGLPVEKLRGMIRSCQAGETDYQELTHNS